MARLGRAKPQRQITTKKTSIVPPPSGRIMSSLVKAGGLAKKGGLAGKGGGLVG